MNTYAVCGCYKSYKNWQLVYELERLGEIYRKTKNFQSNWADEYFFHQKKAADLLIELDKICDEMNIRGI
jgi:hypothetical protein